MKTLKYSINIPVTTQTTRSSPTRVRLHKLNTRRNQNSFSSANIVSKKEHRSVDTLRSTNVNSKLTSNISALLPLSKMRNDSITSICVFGASGDLAKKKIFPALFSLYIQGSLPLNFAIYGFARTKMTDDEFRNMITSTLTCRITTKSSTDCQREIKHFLRKCFYQAGSYDREDSFLDMHNLMNSNETDINEAHRIFFYSIPSNIFVSVAKHSMRIASSTKGYTRVVVEKPFGKDTESSEELSRKLSGFMTEEQIYRIDHYLGKELIDNLSILRFSNTIFQPLWSRQYIDNVQIIFSEPFGTEGRGGYFNQYNIIRDIMQNHLLQVLTLFAMETPISLSAEDIRNEKVKVLQSIRPPTLRDVVVGQYKESTRGDVLFPAYTDDPTVPNNSICPTFAAVALFIDNPRWAGVPFLMKAGKALDKRNAEIRVQFREVPAQLYSQCGLNDKQLTNELVIHIQPDEEIYLKINNKLPGLGVRLDNSHLNLTYKTRYKKELPDAYEVLLLDVMNGDKRLFIRGDELKAAWNVFTPVLHQLEREQIQPEMYPYGSRGPIGAHYLASKYDIQWGDL